MFKFVIDYSNFEAYRSVTEVIQKLMNQFAYEHWVIVCIGTDRSTGDALGPLIGSKLTLMDSRHFKVFGTLDEPIHALNLSETIDRIEELYPSSGVIAIDASLGKMSSVGSIQIVEGPIKPGAGVKKDLPEIGHFHITGIVNVGGFMEYFVLQNTRLSIVMKMAEIISISLSRAMRTREYKNENAVNV